MIYCPYCAKAIRNGWMASYSKLNVFVGRDAKGRPCHKACADGAEKAAFARAMRLPVQAWQATDRETLSSTELGRLNRMGKYGKL